MPLPIEMFCRKIRSTMSGETCATSDAGRPDKRAIQDRRKGLRRNTGRILDREVQLERSVGPLHRPGVGVGLALRHVMITVERPRRHVRRDFLELIGVAQKQRRPVGRIRKHVERVEEVLKLCQEPWRH